MQVPYNLLPSLVHEVYVQVANLQDGLDSHKAVHPRSLHKQGFSILVLMVHVYTAYANQEVVLSNLSENYCSVLDFDSFLGPSTLAVLAGFESTVVENVLMEKGEYFFFHLTNDLKTSKDFGILENTFNLVLEVARSTIVF